YVRLRASRGQLRHRDGEEVDRGPLLPAAELSGLGSPGSGRRHDTGQLLRQLDARARVVGARQPLLVGGETADVVHLEQELARAERIARVLPRQLEQTEAVGRALVVGDEVAMQVRSDLGAA